MQNHLAVAARAEGEAGRFQLPAQLLKVVDLSVEDEPELLRCVCHRLMSARREIDNGQAAMAEDDAPIAADPGSFIIRTAMGHLSHHRFDADISHAFGGGQSDDSAHDAYRLFRTAVT